MDWYEIADALDSELAGARHGARMLRAREWGESRGLRPQTLRTYERARRFILALRDGSPDMADRLRAAPAIAVETLERWHVRDPEAALAAARKLAAGELTVRMLNALEMESRREPVGRKAAWLAALASGPSGGDLRPANPSDRGRRIDLYFRGCPAMVVGPYAVVEQYAVRAPDWILKGLGLARLRGRAALLVPAAGAESFFRGSFIEEGRGHDLGLEVAVETADGGLEFHRR